jgi:phosphoserine phosphatase RsbU/P
MERVRRRDGERHTAALDAADAGEREQRHHRLIARLRREAAVRDDELVALRQRLLVAADELDDLRAIRDALTPLELPQRPGLELAVAFVPAVEHVKGDFYLVAAGPQDSTVLVIGDAVGHGLRAARRAAFVRTTFASTAPFSDDPCRLLSWANTALVERAGLSSKFVTAACMTYLPEQQLLRWAYAGHPPALRMTGGRAPFASAQGPPLGLSDDAQYTEGSLRSGGATSVLLYTNGLTEARHDRQPFGLESVSAALGELTDPSPGEAVAILRERVAAFAVGGLKDELCMLAARTG